MIAWKVILGLAISTIVYALVQNWKRVRLWKKMLRQFSSPPTLPIIGNVHLILGSSRDRARKLLKLWKKYESPLVFWLSYMPVLVLTKLEDIQVVSNKCVDRDVLGIFHESFGDGIAVARAEKWKKSRRLLNPAFSQSMLQQYLLVFNEQMRILVRLLKKEADTDKMFDIWPYMVNANVDSIIENMTGTKLKTQERLYHEFSTALFTATKLESLRWICPWLLPPFVFYIYRLITGNVDVFRKIHELPKRVLMQKETERRENGSTIDHIQPTALVDILIRHRQSDPHFTHKQLRDEMLNVIVTGSESTAVMGSFVLLMLAMNRDAQVKVYEEAAEVLGTDATEVRFDDTAELKYLDQCIKETLRIFTLFPLTMRKTAEDIVLNDNRVIPANCQVMMALPGVHFDSRLYPDPFAWNPQNFAPAAIESRPKNSFIPFGIGPRSCIGYKYAMLSLKTQISHIVLNYRLETDIKLTDLQPTLDAIIRNKFGYPMKIFRRNQ